MEKVIYPVWRAQDVSEADFRASLLGPFSEQALANPLVRGLKVCVVDEAVAPADGYRMESIFPRGYDGVVLVWVEHATGLEADHLGLADYCEAFHGYLVSEAEQIPGYHLEAKEGERTRGMNEIVCLKRPDRLSFEEWRDIWQNSHTQIAIDTQSTFGYRQNLVIRKLDADSPDIDAIIEENFPEAAIHGRPAFYDAGDDEALYQEREKIMVESCMRFIDFDRIDCIPTSEYVVKLV